MKRPATTQQSVRIDYVCHGAGRIELRRFDPSRDSYVALTALLHRAFTRLGAMGLNCTCVDQTVETTRSRASQGDCYVAVCEGRIVDFVRFDGKRYDSAILSKPPVATRTLANWSHRLTVPTRIARAA